MANPYASVPVKNYNLNPPTDGGEQTTANEITWAKHKQKIGDPLKSAFDLIVESAGNAFARTAGGITTVSDNYSVLSGDQGRTVRVTGDNKTVTLISPTTVGAKFRVSIVNQSSTNLMIVPAGAETIDGGSSLTLRSRGGVTLDTDGTNWFSEGLNYEDNASALSLTVRAPEGYMTLASGTPVLVGDVTSASSVYYTPDVGADVPIPDGLQIQMKEISELTLSLTSNHVANGIYDVFLFSDSDGVVRIATGPAWNTPTVGAGARGTGAATTELERWKGFLVNKFEVLMRNGSDTWTIGARKALYVGSIWIDASAGRVSCHRSFGQSRKWGVWNYYNRKPIILKAGDSTASWFITDTGSWGLLNGSSANKISALCGVADELIVCALSQGRQFPFSSATTRTMKSSIGIGVNSTSSPSGLIGMLYGRSQSGNLMRRTPTAQYIQPPTLGITEFYCLEKHEGQSGTTAFGAEAAMQMLIEYRG